MAPRNPELPEGTDQIISGAAADNSTTGNGGFVARHASGEAGGATDRLVSQVRDQVVSLRGQAGERLRGLADDGKGRATTLLQDVASVIEDAAKSIDERLGDEIGDYAHRASDAVAGFATRVRDKSVDDIVDDTKGLVRSSPAIAIAAAAVAGFALIRLVRSGWDGAEGGAGKSGGARSARARGGSRGKG